MRGATTGEPPVRGLADRRQCGYAGSRGRQRRVRTVQTHVSGLVEERIIMTMTLVANPDLCTGCNHCVLACSARHENQSEPALARLSINGFPQQGYSVPSVCFHCKRPDCLAACPEQAIMRSADGIVTIDADICTGCGKCVPACPWGMVRKHPVTGKAFKCDLCGGDPACVAECAFGALIFVEWEGEAAVIKTKQMKFKNEYGSPELKRDAFGKSILNEAGRQMSNTPVSPVRIPVRAPSCDGLFMPAEWTEHELSLIHI
eukprot:TRINITY_DN22411_c0_g2_i1.p1 TRINITY_DN22411_c0_g2~~TRINITY_DN22411_c0_g2_i1.p1  ORF type:complete len:260 (+),score=55.22 TRINITY_DN22411_c0_g2_i1:473-1252(+)